MLIALWPPTALREPDTARRNFERHLRVAASQLRVSENVDYVN